ncbi:hypothetical protein AHMF7616_00446 [Adhaeribacter pallidiroseus]|uniref:Uncharacterized protein n=1 Tax=Adhaeribacter pallidiroseus TaxID=2072847 RepID=A0A369QF26_9BACT|nr:hypothetical protein AHMF7616_00446 [Adhaeribacter pallidiroseus]
MILVRVAHFSTDLPQTQKPQNTVLSRVIFKNYSGKVKNK